MKEFLNESKKQFKDCTGEEMKCLASAEGCQFFSAISGWGDRLQQDNFNRNVIYRTTPIEKRMPQYPWDVLSDEVVACSFNIIGRLVLHERQIENTQTSTHIKFDRGTVDWRDSLQMRPVAGSNDHSLG